MLPGATMVEETDRTQVFVDSTGRRKRRLAAGGFFVTLFAAIYMGAVGVSVVQASEAGLSTRATVTPSASPATSASASATSSSSH